jgi:SNF2 family DNA or RNA helicase
MNARVARTGQTRPTEVYHLLSPGTMDDAVMTSLENKATEQNLLQESLKKFQTIYESKSY